MSKVTGRKIVEHKNRPYDFEAYNPRWPAMFSQIEDIIRKILGNEVITIEHVGSTSIPGLPSKPQIDVLITVKSLKNIPQYYNLMQTQGFTARGDYTQEGEEYFTKDNAKGKREVSIHVLPEGHRWARELVDFRDYLRSHPGELKKYAAIKAEMHRKFPSDYTNYYKGKLKVMLELVEHAKGWRDPSKPQT